MPVVSSCAGSGKGRHAARSRQSRWRRPCSSPAPARSASSLALLVLAGGLAAASRRALHLAARSRVGAESEAEVRRVLERLVRDGWQVRHAVDWPRPRGSRPCRPGSLRYRLCDRDQDAALDARAPGAHERRGTLAGAATPAVPARRGAGAVRHARAARSARRRRRAGRSAGPARAVAARLRRGRSPATRRACCCALSAGAGGRGPAHYVRGMRRLGHCFSPASGATVAPGAELIGRRATRRTHPCWFASDVGR